MIGQNPSNPQAQPVTCCDLSVFSLLHSKLRSITPMATKVHVILRSFVVLTWMRDTIELV